MKRKFHCTIDRDARNPLAFIDPGIRVQFLRRGIARIVPGGPRQRVVHLRDVDQFRERVGPAQIDAPDPDRARVGIGGQPGHE